MFCTICFDTISCLEILTSCGHTYHQKCLDHWFCASAKKNCPVCQRVINYTLAGRRTRSKTEDRRTKKILIGCAYYIELFNISAREEEKKKLVDTMFNLLYMNRVLFRKKRKLFYFVYDFIKKLVDSDEYYRKLYNWWEILDRS